MEYSKMLMSIDEDEKVTITNSNSGENKLYLHTIESKQEFVNKGYFEVIEGCKTLREKTLT
ncbi:hypothetical protein [Clostridium beijerinckii]|uniref:hypothetical protein n=2 Tax=Clostridium beijerinckii TaxID=1520 RepID=UPI001360E151|nr:hypothetical protein [Clostridium beijerinckii]MZK76805.1 hypothetical protein [Clostridium beijerinckii]MZL00814.1 hypothetical protein [Clostridium beijerinckii]MZL20523.1 hypothetical protein [Clostridium beijerinckii]MZL30599.1 hypothetical protein [Clostridium beijerinckii]